MTPCIALDLSLDGVAVLTRVPSDHADAGKWWLEGRVSLDQPDMAEALVALREKAETRTGPDQTTLLILPDSQLLYTSLERDDRRAEETIRALLRGRTPYAVEDLTFDYMSRGDRLQVAVVALETLLEAETFAAEFGFRPVAVVANPDDPAYPAIPSFGETGIAADLLGGAKLDLRLGDGFKIIPGPSAPRAASPPTEPEASPAPVFASPRRAAVQEPVNEPELPLAPPPKPRAPRAEPRLAPPKSVPKPSVAPPTPVAAPPKPAAAPPAAKAPDVAKPAPPGTPPVVAPPAAPEAEPPAARFTHNGRRKPLTAEDRQASVDRLAKIAPRISSGADAPADPKSTAEEIAAAVKTPRADGPMPKARAPRPLASRSQPLSIEPAPAPKAAAASLGLGAMMGKLKSKPIKPKTPFPRAEPAPMPSEKLDEAEALALPGLGRERAAAGKHNRLGLYMTMGLIAAMVLIGAGASLFTGAPDTSEIAENPLALETDGAIETPDAVALADPAEGETDLAALIPDATSDEALVSEASPIPNLIAPPLPIPGQTPEELAEARPVIPDVEGQLLAEETPGLDVVAELDAPPNQDIATPAQPREFFDAAGVFDLSNPLSLAPSEQSVDDIVVASIDPNLDFRASAIAPAAPAMAVGFAPQTTPPAPGTSFELTGDGLVVASVEGTVAPGGYTVILGRPTVMPVQRAVEAATAEASAAEASAAETEELDAAREELRRVRPVQRPEDRTQTEEQADDAEDEPRPALASIVPRQRPDSIVAEANAAAAEAQRAAEEAEAAATAAEQAAAASLAQQQAEAAAAAAAAALAQTAPGTTPEVSSGPVSPLALAQSERPRTRPRSVEREAARIVTQRRQQASASASTAAAPPAPQAETGRQTIRSAGGNVARAATDRNVLRLNQINLIGVYGRPSARRALVRLSNGRFVKVEVGDRLDRGRVTAIGESELSYQRGGRNVVLRMPRA